MAKKIPNIVKRIKSNPPEKVNFAYQKNVSYSQMSIYRQCAHRWKLQYKDKIKRQKQFKQSGDVSPNFILSGKSINFHVFI